MLTLGNHLLDLVTEGDMVVVKEFDPTDQSVARATPIRFKLSDSGGRLAADLPGVDPNLFITDTNGSITNG